MKMANYLFDKKQQQQQKNEIEPKEVLKSAAQSFWSSWSRVDLKVYSEIKIGNNTIKQNLNHKIINNN